MNAYRQIERDTEAARRGVSPDVLVNVYGNHPPKAAERFGGRGATSMADIQDALQKRRDARPGQYDHKR